MTTPMLNLPVSKLWNDQLGEYSSSEMRLWSKEKGIVIEGNILYTLQLNGVAELVNRSIGEKVRTMLLESNISKNMWYETALAAVYFINISPAKD